VLKRLSGEVLAWLSVYSKVPIISCFIKIQNGLTFSIILVPAYPDCPRKEAIK